MKQLIKILILSLTLLSCSNNNNELIEPVLDLTPTNPPFTLTIGSTFYENIAYDSDARNVFDFFMPNKNTPSTLCILIHGGGFLRGDKTIYYSSNYYKQLINSLLEKNIAVASINYRFINDTDTEGILKCLNDSKRSLQFMRYYSNSLNFNKQKVVLFGGSAGAGTSLWIGFNDDMADTNNPDLVLNESTRVQGIVVFSTQASYDILEWHNTIFSEYQVNGFNYNSVKNIITEPLILNYLGVNNPSQLYSTQTIAYRNSINMLNLMSSDDPEFYAATSNTPYVLPSNKSELYHHPLHVKSLQNRATDTNTLGIFYSPELGIDTRNGENVYDFIVRKIGN